MSERSLTAADIARELSCSRSEAYEIMREMPRVVHGRKVRVTRKAFEQWRKRHTIQPWQDSTSAGNTGGTNSRESGTQRVAPIAKQPKLSLVRSSAGVMTSRVAAGDR